MITWQDPVALALAASLIGLSWWWRRWLIKRGSAPHCVQCNADQGADGSHGSKPARPTVVDVGKLRLSRPR